MTLEILAKTQSTTYAWMQTTKVKSENAFAFEQNHSTHLAMLQQPFIWRSQHFQVTSGQLDVIVTPLHNSFEKRNTLEEVLCTAVIGSIFFLNLPKVRELNFLFLFLFFSKEGIRLDH